MKWNKPLPRHGKPGPTRPTVSLHDSALAESARWARWAYTLELERHRHPLRVSRRLPPWDPSCSTEEWFAIAKAAKAVGVDADLYVRRVVEQYVVENPHRIKGGATAADGPIPAPAMLPGLRRLATVRPDCVLSVTYQSDQYQTLVLRHAGETDQQAWCSALCEDEHLDVVFRFLLAIDLANSDRKINVQQQKWLYSIASKLHGMAAVTYWMARDYYTLGGFDCFAAMPQLKQDAFAIVCNEIGRAVR